MVHQKRLYEQTPQNLEEAIKGAIDYPRSPRMANQLFDVGVSLLKEHDLFVPFWPSESKLAYIPIREDYSRFSMIHFSRNGLGNMSEYFDATVVSPEEKKGIRVTRHLGIPFRVILYHVYDLEIEALGPKLGGLWYSPIASYWLV